ncbi:MAG: PA14 domain-containing protein [Bacteroidota bacterium]|nr:PA14 domain-containing protein [Bacteroidota bacterium]
MKILQIVCFRKSFNFLQSSISKISFWAFLVLLVQDLFIWKAIADTGQVKMLAMQTNGMPLDQMTVRTEKGNERAWVISERNSYLTFRPASPYSFSKGSKLYLAVTYFDDCYGRIKVQYNGKDRKNKSPERIFRGAPGKTDQTVTAMFLLDDISPEKQSGNQPIIRIGLERAKGDRFVILGVTLQNQPFNNQQFQYILSSPWIGTYNGPTVKPADNTTLKGKVMVGYQGWFRTPNDPEARGWVHWGDIQNGNYNVDMWPDISQYPKQVLEKAADIKTLSGKPGYLFSSAWPEVADLHFRWMREHDIDGAFLQRFVSDKFCSISGGSEWVLANVREAANREGRIWAIEYDVSGYADAKILETLKKDWKWMVDTFGILKDPNYAYENGKPVVFIWGLPFPDRNFTLKTSNAVVDFFKNDPKYGVYLIGGIPGNWRKMDVGWQDHFKKYDAVLSWMSRSYADDVADFAKLGVIYYPHVKPGFSWSNLMHIPTGSTEAYTPREGGKFYWNCLCDAAKAKVDRLFIGMFDEYDEGTAIMPMSDDAPPTPSRPGLAVQFFKNNKFQGRPFNTSYADIDFDLASIPQFKGKVVNGFGIRWIGQIKPPTPGEYTFTVEGVAGDRARLFINDKRVLDVKEFGLSHTDSAKVMVDRGEKLLLRLDYSPASTVGKVRLLWKGPGIVSQLVPQSVFTDAWGRFNNNEGHNSDWYLKLTQYGKEMMLGKRPEDSPIPEK